MVEYPPFVDQMCFERPRAGRSLMLSNVVTTKTTHNENGLTVTEAASRAPIFVCVEELALSAR